MADVFGLPVQRLTNGEQSALGAILLAGTGLGLFELNTTAQRWANYTPPVEPNDQRHIFYGALLALFRSAYQKHREDFRQLQSCFTPALKDE